MFLLRSIIYLLILLPNIVQPLELSPLAQSPHFGDLDSLEKKGTIRVLVSADLGFYYIEKGQPKGIIAEFLHHFELHLKKHHVNVNIQVIPVARDELLPTLKSGLGDIAAANLTITSERLQHIDFSDPIISDSQEWLVTSKSIPTINSYEELSGKEVWIRASSSYFASLQNINKQLSARGIAPIQVRFIEETLQDTN